MRTVWTFHSATQLVFGGDAIQQLGDLVARLECKKALVVTDPVLVKAGIWEQARKPLAAAGIETLLFDQGAPEPALEVAEACIDFARAGRPDVVVGLGGGSNLDLAKIVAVALTHGGGPRDYFGEDKVPGPIMPLVCATTTAGTGSEVSSAAVVTDAAQQTKVSTLSNHLRPRIALVDPWLTLSCPPKVTADSGIDALTHAIEAYTAVDNASYPLPPGERSVYQGLNPMGDLVAEKAIALCGKFLLRAVRNGQDRDARDGMALAATLAGLAFSNVGVALVHALEYPVGALVHCSHGAGNGLLLPYVMRFNLPGREERMARVGELLGADVAGLSPAAAAEKAISAVEALRDAIDVPGRLRDIGVPRDRLAELAGRAHLVKRLLRVNPRPATVADLTTILESAW